MRLPGGPSGCCRPRLPEDIGSWVVMLARKVGRQSQKGRRRPGNEVLRETWKTVQVEEHQRETEWTAMVPGTRWCCGAIVENRNAV